MKKQYWLNNTYNNAEKYVVIQRLTALWAFAESGLGGVLHALQVPFTGLIVGGIAIMIITLIATISEQVLKNIIKALLIVVVVKLTISPYTPITAYVALLFQAGMGIFIYHVFSINYISIFIFCSLAMLESALQKILLLVLFYGKNFYIATNEFINFILHQFSLQSIDASFIILVAYIIIYFLGGVFISIVTHKIIKTPLKQLPLLNKQNVINISNKKNKFKQPILYLVFAILIVLSIYFFSEQKSTQLKVLYSLVFSFSIIIFWYFILTPFVSKQLLKYLKIKEYKHKEEIHNIINFIPTIQYITTLAWQQSKAYKGFYRLYIFITAVFSWIILHQQQIVIESEC